MSDEDNRAFIEAYLDNWRKTPPDLREVFLPEGRLLPPGRTEPLDVAGAQRLVEGTRAAIPDVSLRIVNWAEREGQMFIEWEMAGTVGGKRVRWSGINRNTLRSSKSIDAVSYWDRHGLVEQLDPDGPKLDIMQLMRKVSRP
jgi:hypothetical protein